MQIKILEGIKSPAQVPTSIKRIREHMQTSHADLCMLKLTADIERNGQIWQELEQLKVHGWIKTLGVESPSKEALISLLKVAKIVPGVIQLADENPALLEVARKYKIQVEIPVTEDIEALDEIAGHYGSSSLELVMRYFSQRKIVPLIIAEDMLENPQTDFLINQTDLATIDQLFAQK